MAIVDLNDFVGEIKLPKTSFSDIDKYIEQCEEDVLINLLGAELYGLFKADLTTSEPQIPQTDRFIKLFNPFYIDKDDLIVCSKGMKKMLAQFIYFEFIRDLQYEQTASGTMKTNSELGIHAEGLSNEVAIYNKAVNNVHAIQWYIYENKENYQEENSQTFNHTSGI